MDSICHIFCIIITIIDSRIRDGLSSFRDLDSCDDFLVITAVDRSDIFNITRRIVETTHAKPTIQRHYATFTGPMTLRYFL